MRAPLVVAALMVAWGLLAVPLPAASQSTATPDPLAAGAVKSYCHVLDADNIVWMNTLVDDGDAAPYEFYGAPAQTLPGVGAGIDPVAEEDFEARIALSPALTQDIVLEGTVNVQAYIGGGTYTAGSAMISSSLVADGAVLGEGEETEHTMTPKQAGETYDPISWSFDVPATAIPAGSVLEWVISGYASGNNIFLACHEARGRSYIELPVASASGGLGGGITQALNGTTARMQVAAAEATNATHTYTWMTNLTAQSLRATGVVETGNATLTIVDGANKTVLQQTLTGNTTQGLQGTPGNWTFTLQLAGFAGNLTIEVGPAASGGLGGGTGTGTSTRTGSGGATGTASITGAAGNGTKDDDEKDTPAPLTFPVAVSVLLAAVVLLRRRMG